MNIKTMMEEIAQEELERDGAACREVMQSRKSVGQRGKIRLIDANALPRTQIVECRRVFKNGRLGVRNVTVNVVRAEDVGNAPAVDAVPVVHGRWENGNPYCPICRKDKFRGLDADVWADWKPDYCPNCGAKMDGGDD